MSWCSPDRTYPLNKDEWKESGRRAQAEYPAGYQPVTEHPVLLCRASDRPRLRDRLMREPWKTWYEKTHRPLAMVAMAAKDLTELSKPDFSLQLFPLTEGPPRVEQGGGGWMYYLANLALVAFLEDDASYRRKAIDLLLEAARINWNSSGWGGDDYDTGSGWTPSWVANAMLVVAYDLVADGMTAEERHPFEARLARDLEWAQTDPVSPRYNPSWFGCAYIVTAGLLLGRHDYVRKIEAMLDQYVDQVLWGEGEYFEGSSYQAGCMEAPNHLCAYAIRHVTGRNPFDNPRWSLRAEHWVRRCGPLGSDVTHSDAGLMELTVPELMASLSMLDSRVAGHVVWLWQRIGDPGWFPVVGNDEERASGVSIGGRRPHIPLPTTLDRKRRYPQPMGANPAGWLMVPDPLPEAVEPPPGSYVARGAGLARLRTNWNLDAMSACLFAPRFYGSPHTRWDALTFDLWAHGAYLVKNPGYGELCSDKLPRIGDELAKLLGVTRVRVDDVIPPPPPWKTWNFWDDRKCYRLSPGASNVPTIDGGGGHCKNGRCDPMHFVLNTGWAQAVRVNGGFNYTYYATVGTDGDVIRTLIQVESGDGLPGYWVVVDDVLPKENPQALCEWHLHPAGTFTGDNQTFTWQMLDFLNFPPKRVGFEVVPPSQSVAYELRPHPTHIGGGSIGVGQFITARWTGRRRFWTVLRPAAAGETLPSIRRLDNDLGLVIGERDVILVRPIDSDRISHGGVETDAAVVVTRDGGKGFWLAAAGTFLATPGGAGFKASIPVLATANGERGVIFVDRPHKQVEPMTPVTFEPVSATAGPMQVVLPTPGMHPWQWGVR